MSARRRRSLVVVSVLLLAAGAVLATVARPTEEVSAAVSGAGGAPLLVAGPDVLASRPGPVVVRATGAGPVLVAVGRDDDVDAWAQGAAVTTATRLQDGDTVTTTRTTGDQQVPDPSGSDLWTAQARGTGSARLAVDPSTGPWSVLVASDGTSTAPGDVELVWTQRPVPVAAWLLLGAGALLGLLLLRRRAVSRTTSRETRTAVPVTVVLPPERQDAAPPETAEAPRELLRPRGRRSAR